MVALVIAYASSTTKTSLGRGPLPVPVNDNSSDGGNVMLNRRAFAALLAGSVAAPRTTWSEPVQGKTVFYASTGGELAL